MTVPLRHRVTAEKRKFALNTPISLLRHDDDSNHSTYSLEGQCLLTFDIFDARKAFKVIFMFLVSQNEFPTTIASYTYNSVNKSAL
jgi:hypothetical protein